MIFEKLNNHPSLTLVFWRVFFDGMSSPKISYFSVFKRVGRARKTPNPVEEKHVNSPLMTPIVSEWLDFFWIVFYVLKAYFKIFRGLK
jgi:hypothetical protein